MLCALLLTTQLDAQSILVSRDSAQIPDIELGEVVVAASRDNSKIKDIPSSITSIRTGDIESNQIQSLEDLSTFAPNFMMLDYGTKIMSPVYIRGIGSKKSTVSPSVGLYVDGIPYFDNSALSFDFYDIKQVEVLRGPQGTLFGRNTIGGLINVNTLSPMTYQGTRFRVTAGTYDAYNATLSHYDRIGNKLAFSVAGNYNYQGGYFTNTYDDSKADESMSYGLRNRIIYNINSKFTVENVLGFETSEQHGYAYAPYVDSISAVSDVNYDTPSGYDRFMFNDGINFTYEGHKTLGNLTLSYHHVNDDQKVDQDFKPQQLLFADQSQIQNMFSAEAIFRSKEEKAYRWIFGVSSNVQALDKAVKVNYYTPYNTIFAKDYYEKNYFQTNTSTGFFHQSKYQITPDLTLTAGIRFNYEKSDLDYDESQIYEGDNTLLMDTSFSALTDFVILPKLAIQYNFNQSTIYASFATGYKSGGFNSTFENSEQVKFGKETSNNYEIGFKTDILEGIIYSDVSFFLSTLEGQHITRSLETLTGTYIDNSGTSENKGAELTLNIAPINGFEASVSYGYTLAEITEYVKSSSVNYNGNIAPYVPNHTLNIMIAQTVETKNLSYLDNYKLQINFQQVGDTYWDLENSMLEEAYNVTNMTLSFNYKNLKLDVWGKNLFDTYYHAYMFKTSAWYGQKGQPRRFGTTLSMNF